MLQNSYQMPLRYFGLDFWTNTGLKSKRTTSDWHNGR